MKTGRADEVGTGAEDETLGAFQGHPRARQRFGLRQSPGALGGLVGGLARRESRMAKRSQGERLLTAGVGLDFDLWQVCNMPPATPPTKNNVQGPCSRRSWACWRGKKPAPWKSLKPKVASSSNPLLFVSDPLDWRP